MALLLAFDLASVFLGFSAFSLLGTSLPTAEAGPVEGFIPLRSAAGGGVTLLGKMGGIMYYIAMIWLKPPLVVHST